MPKSNQDNDPARRKAKLSLGIASTIFGFLGVTLFVPLLMSVMAFDAPGSEKNVTTWIVFLSLFTFSPICLLSIFISWGLYVSEKYNASILMAFSPLINVFVLCIFFSVSYILETPSRMAWAKIERQKFNQRSERLEELCEQNLIEIFNTAENAKSLYFSNYQMNEAWWLWRENLDFIEIRNFDKNNIPVYTRVIKDLSPQREGSSVVPTIRMVIDKPEAQYELNYVDITNNYDKNADIQIKEFYITDRQKDELMAHYTIVKTRERTCPSVDPTGGRLLSYILGTMKPEKREDFERKLSKYTLSNQHTK